MVLGRFHLQSSLPQGTSPQPRRITPLQLPNPPPKGGVSALTLWHSIPL
jgi:hypothetical protein